VLCERVVHDLRATGMFATVKDCETTHDSSDMTVEVDWYTTRRFDDWCTGDTSIGLSLLTAGIVPACSCPAGYELQFMGRGDRSPITVRLAREACTYFGWVSPFLNLRDDYHWFGPADATLQAQALRIELMAVRTELAQRIAAQPARDRVQGPRNLW
jgi:hypothetical protein